MKEKKIEPEVVDNSLMVMMVSLNLILLIFFVYLNSMGVDDDQKIKKALGSLAGTFGILPSGLHLSEGKKLLIPGTPLVSPDFNDMSIGREFKRVINDRGHNRDAFVTEEGDDLVLHMAGKMLFSSGESELLPEVRAGFLNEVFKVIQRHPFPIRIEGYTDNMPIATEKYPSNWELSAARATSILQYLHLEKKIPIERLTAIGYGEYKPVLPNNRPENREKNRRVRIVLLKAAI